MVAWDSDYYKVYCNTCQFTHSAPVLQGMDKCHRDIRDRRISHPDTMLHVPETSTVSGRRNSTVNCRQTLLLGPAGWAIFILLFQIVNSPLRNLLFSLLPTHLPPSNPSKYVHTHPNPRGDTIQAASHPHVNQLVQIDLGGWSG